MRVPMDYQINTSVNAYLAMKACLIVLKQNKQLRKIAIPGLCTGTGNMPVHIAALQMFLAFDEIMNENYRDYKTVNDLHKYQFRLNEKGKIWNE